jgi:hypothetical protein
MPKAPTNTLPASAETAFHRLHQLPCPSPQSVTSVRLANPARRVDRPEPAQAQVPSSSASNFAKLPQELGHMYEVREPVWQDGIVREFPRQLLQALQAFCNHNKTEDLPCASRSWTGGNTVEKMWAPGEVPRYRSWQTIDNGEKLKVGRFRDGSGKQIIVVQGEKGSTWQQGNPVIIVFSKMIIGNSIWKIWRGQRKLREIPEADAAVECELGDFVLEPARPQIPIDKPHDCAEKPTKLKSYAFSSAHQRENGVEPSGCPQSRRECRSLRQQRRASDDASQRIHTLYRESSVLDSTADSFLSSAPTGMPIIVKPSMGQDARQIKAASEERHHSRELKQVFSSTQPGSDKRREPSSSSDSDEPIARKKLRAKLTETKTQSLSGYGNQAAKLLHHDFSTNVPLPTTLNSVMTQQDATPARSSSGGSSKLVNYGSTSSGSTDVFESAASFKRLTQLSSHTDSTNMVNRTPLMTPRSSTGPSLSTQIRQRANARSSCPSPPVDRNITFFFINANDDNVFDCHFTESRDDDRLFARARVAGIITRTTLLLEADVGGEAMLVQKECQKDFDRMKAEIVRMAVTEVVIANGD